MTLHVCFEIGALVERLTANGTFVGRFIGMRCLVDGQCARLTKSLATIAAFVRFIFRMNVLVVAQMILSSKCLATNAAGERSLICVSAFVDL